MSSFSTMAAPGSIVPFGAPSVPAIAAAATGNGNLSEKTLELTFCAQFAAELVRRHFFPEWHRIVWFGLTQKQESELAFDAATSLGGRAFILQFKASRKVIEEKGRRFTVEHNQMQTLRTLFGGFPGSCFYVFPDVGTIDELNVIDSNVVGNSWLVDVSDLPTAIPLPTKFNSTALRKSNCHFAYLGNPANGTVEFHSEPFKVRAIKAKEFARRVIYPHAPIPVEKIVQILKRTLARSDRILRRFSRNLVLGILPDRF